MPIMPFILGVITGSVITYVVKDEPSQQILGDTGGKITSGVGNLTNKVTSIFKKAEESVEEVAETVEEATTQTA